MRGEPDMESPMEEGAGNPLFGGRKGRKGGRKGRRKRSRKGRKAGRY